MNLVTCTFCGGQGYYLNAHQCRECSGTGKITLFEREKILKEKQDRSRARSGFTDQADKGSSRSNQLY